MVELIELQGRLRSSRELWQKRLREARKGGGDFSDLYCEGRIAGLTEAIREIGILLRIELA